MDFLNIVSKKKQAKRLAEIIKILSRYSMTGWIKQIPFQTVRNMIASSETQAITDIPLPVRIRLALTEMGTTFIKLGQVLSTRADLVGAEIAEELCKLQADTPADPYDTVKRTIVSEFGKEPEELFQEFEPLAFSSASIGQVHLAKLEDGQTVVVKIQHDSIQEKIHIDLELMEALAKLLQEHVPDAKAYQPVATTREFRRTLLRELDFSLEKGNIEQFTQNFATNDKVHVPEVYPHLCTRRVITMELLSGIPGSKPEKISHSGMDLNEFAKIVATVFLDMIFRDGFYHADPHPGNFILMKSPNGPILGLIDCGMVGRIDESVRELFSDLLLFLMQGDSDGLSELLLRAGTAPPEVDRVAFRTDVSEMLMDYGTQAINDIDIGGALERMGNIIRRYHVILPSSASLLMKTLVMLEGTSRLFNPAFSLAEVLEPYKERMIRERMDPRRWMKRMQKSIRDVDRLMRQGPRNVADILDNLQAGKLKINHEVQGLEIIINRMVAGVLIAALFLGSSTLLNQAFPPLVSGISIIGTLGCLTAIFSGGRLLWTIRKSL